MSALSTKQTPPATRIAISTEGQRPLDLTVTPELLELVDLTTLINRGTSERFNLSFSALLLAFYYGRHGISDWFRQYISEQGADLDAILNYRQLKAEEIQRRIRENDLPFPDPDKEYQQGGRTATSSAHKWLTTAKDLSEQQRHTRTGLRHAMSAVIFTPGFHDEDLNRWRFDRRRWAASYVEYVAQYLPNDLDFLRRLRDRTFPGDSAPSSVPETTSASELLSSVNASAVSRQARQPTDQSVRTAVPSSVPSDLNEKAGSDPSEPPSSAQNLFVTGTPGYTSEFCGLGGNGAVTDSLKVEDLAHRFAELIVLRETKLPLAIGLFGNWGSGKSHFMNLIDRDIKALADRELNPPLAANPGDHAEDPWCREMVPIYFNAWHYSDANLWASLVAEVFDALFARLDRKPDQLGYLQARLQEAGGVTALASEEATQASKVVAQADKALQAARSDSERTGKKVLAFKTGLATLLPELITGQIDSDLSNFWGSHRKSQPFRNWN